MPTYVYILGAAALVVWFFAPSVKAQKSVVHTYLPPVNVAREILAIAGAEAWDPVKRPIGKALERGRLQFTPERWMQLSTKPHRWADSRAAFAIEETHRVEVAHILDLIAECNRLRRRPTPYTVALLHAAGFDAVAAHHVSAMKKDFASRAANIYEELEKLP